MALVEHRSLSKTRVKTVADIKPSTLISIGMTFKSNPKKAIARLGSMLGANEEAVERVQDMLEDDTFKDELIAIILSHIDDIMAGRLTADLISDLENLTGIKLGQ
jgi:hypothetical protein